MKKNSKSWLLLAAALILGGLLLFAVAMGMLHWDFSLLGGTSFETNTCEINKNFRDISIRGGEEDVVFLPSDSGTCRVVFYEREKMEHSAEVKGSTLTIGVTDTRSWRDHIGLFSTGSPKITVYLPQREYASLVIEGATGDVEIPKDFRFESIAVTADTGDVSCQASASGPIGIHLSTGSITLGGASAGELDLSVSTGGVQLRSVDCAGDVKLIVSTGKAVLTDLSCRSFLSEGDTGGVRLTNVIAADRIRIERTTGDVELDGCDAAELYLTADTGDVRGTLLSEKVFLVQSDTGRIDVPKTITGGRCEITTDTGDITMTVK